MHKRFIQSFECCFPDEQSGRETLAGISAGLPRRAARRMSTLGILMHSVLEKHSLDLETAVVYGTTFTETNALEKYLESLPFASPTAFQTSIHPGGIEQALILRKQEVGTFLPFAGEEDLMMQLLKSAFSSDKAKTLICGGEEKGTWLQDYGVAYPRSFAFSLLVTEEPNESIGSIVWEPNANGCESPVLSMEETVRHMASAQRLRMGSSDHGIIEICWE